MSHTIEHQGFRMTGNPDLSGDVKLQNDQTEDVLFVPGELLALWFSKYFAAVASRKWVERR